MSHEKGPEWMMLGLVSSSCPVHGVLGKENLPEMT